MTAQREQGHANPLSMVLLATLASTVGFWAWTVIGPLAARYAEWLQLGSGAKAVLVATPVLVGSLGRVVVGALTDRYGGRVMFTAILLLSAPAVLLVAMAGSGRNFVLLLVAALWLGVAGTIFAVGIPFSSAWYPPEQRGFATGVFGMGMIGTAVSAFFTPRLVTSIGYWPTHLLVAALMLVTAGLVWLVLRDSPSRVANADPLVPKVLGTLKLPVTWQMSFLYAVVFGGFVAFCTYLPTYLKDIHDLDLAAAGARTAGFAVAAVVLRPVGGVLADRVGPWPVTLAALGLVAALAFVVSLQPQGEIANGLVFLSMAAALGLGTGSVFGWVGRLAPPKQVGAVSGVVAAAGGLGGYFPPLIMGGTYDPVTRSYAIGLWLLVATAVVAAVFVAFWLRPRRPGGDAATVTE